ncbi:uncharacterized protein HD556DRAFT_1439999 [Suillus plorans]|uniref:Uncharacterized protein n=1 Tax=Suillus plorans TaxID=116603 RepID=A0A9P7DN54_9AGAM|nr:uncharacterized protein HD556DRAFT_1439999 [Suillus plorans]KAG1798936.1 hypothetical protein HD556DRAFT_1439999 [Suillus plorans]
MCFFGHVYSNPPWTHFNNPSALADYAKLVRKREKALANGETPSIQRIDMEMLRASARAADADKGGRAALGGGSAGGAVMNSVSGNGHGSGSGSGGGNSNGGGDDKMNLGIHQGSFQINTDAGDAMQDQDPNMNSQSSAGGTYTRPPRPAHSKRPSSTRVMQSPGVMGGQHPSAGVSHHPSGQTPSMSHHTTPSVQHHQAPSTHHQTPSAHHQTPSAHHQTPSAHHQTPSVQHHQTPSISHHTTPSVTHQSGNSSSGSTSRHPPAASHTPAAPPASQQNQGHHQPTAQGHHQSGSAQGHHQSTTQGHHQSTAQGHHQSGSAQGHHQSTSAQGHHQTSVHHPPSRLVPPPTPPWYLPAANQSHSMLRQ